MAKCVLAVLAVTLVAAAGAQEPAKPLAVRIMSYGKFDKAAWQHMPAIGLSHVFLPVPAPGEVDAVMKQLKESGLKPLVLRGSTDLANESSVDELAAQAATCEKMGVKFMFLSPKHVGVSKEVAIERLRKAGDAAQKHGVIISLETHPDLGTNGDVHLETMKAINHPNVRVNFDTGNITYYNKGADAVSELKKIVDYVATVEFKDHSGGFEEWTFPTLGQGKVDFPGAPQGPQRAPLRRARHHRVRGHQGHRAQRGTNQESHRGLRQVRQVGRQLQLNLETPSCPQRPACKTPITSCSRDTSSSCSASASISTAACTA